MTTIKERLTREYQKLYDCKQRSLAREKKMPIRYLIGTADAFCTQLDISENGSLLGFRCCGFEMATIFDNYEQAELLCRRMNANAANTGRGYYKVFTTEKILTLQSAAYDSVLTMLRDKDK